MMSPYSRDALNLQLSYPTRIAFAIPALVPPTRVSRTSPERRQRPSRQPTFSGRYRLEANWLRVPINALVCRSCPGNNG